MSTLDLSKDSRRRPDEVVADLRLSTDALALLPKSTNTFAYLEALCAEELFADAFLTLARTLPRQYAVIWAAQCVDELLGLPDNAEDRRCVEVARQWLKAPDEKGRRTALDVAEARNYEGAYAWLAAAVGFSGGSLAPENQAEIKPPPHLTAVAVSACLMLAAVAAPEAYAERSRSIVERGLTMVAIPGGAASAATQR
jgi:hypothetical protein